MGDIVAFTQISRQIVKFEWISKSITDSFPVLPTRGLFKTALVEFPVVEALIEARLVLPQQRRRDTLSVQTGWRTGVGKGRECRQNVCKGPGRVADLAGRNI